MFAREYILFKELLIFTVGFMQIVLLRQQFSYFYLTWMTRRRYIILTYANRFIPAAVRDRRGFNLF